jgi:hypothetical protein
MIFERLEGWCRRAVSRLAGRRPVSGALLIACIWLNQGLPSRDYQVLRKVVLEDRTAHPFLWAYQSIAHLYGRSGDEELYYSTLAAITGRAPFGRPLHQHRGPIVPEAFRREAPPADGKWHMPYRDVPIEYPVMALPFIALPFLLSSSFVPFSLMFGALMGLCLWLSTRTLLRDESKEDYTFGFLTLIALLLAHGGLAVQRLDAAPALFVAIATWAAIRKKPIVLGVALGAAAASKFLPALLVGPLLMVLPDLRKPKALVALGTSLVVTMVIGLGPMELLHQGSIASVIQFHSKRGLQIESTGALAQAIVQVIIGEPANRSIHSFGSFNYDGIAADTIAWFCAPLTLLATLVWMLALLRQREPATDSERRDRIIVAVLGGLTIQWLFGKVFSPQYLTWGIPLVAALTAPRWRQLRGLFIATLLLTQYFFRYAYEDLIGQQPSSIAIVCVRQALLVWMLYEVARRLAPDRALAVAPSASEGPTVAEMVTSGPAPSATGLG